MLVMFVVAAFVSIMIHELGHAFMMRRYGASVNIMLYAFGGMAAANRGFSRWQGVVVSLAGPVVQILAGVLMLFLMRVGVNDALVVRAFMSAFVWVSIVWGVMNMLPIYPLDGGQVMGNLLGRGGVKWTFGISVVCAGVLALWCVLNGNIFGTLLLGMLAFENVKRLRGQRADSLLNPQR